MKDLIFGPNGLILLGSIMAIVGAFWSSAQQNTFEKEIARLNKQTLEVVTGGESFCYLTISNLDDKGLGKGILILVQEGKNPLYEVNARLVDLDRFEEVKNKPTFDSLTYSDTNMPLGTINPGAMILRKIDVSALPKKGYNIFFSARNGFFIQVLRYQKVKGIWRQAIKVSRDDKTILEKVDPEFPRNSNGEIVWD